MIYHAVDPCVEALRESDQGRQSASERAAVPLSPEATRCGRIAKAPQLFEIILENIGDEQGAIRSEQFAQPHSITGTLQMIRIAQQNPACATNHAPLRDASDALGITARHSLSKA